MGEGGLGVALHMEHHVISNISVAVISAIQEERDIGAVFSYQVLAKVPLRRMHKAFVTG